MTAAATPLSIPTPAPGAGLLLDPDTARVVLAHHAATHAGAHPVPGNDPGQVALAAAATLTGTVFTPLLLGGRPVLTLPTPPEQSSRAQLFLPGAAPALLLVHR